MTGRVVHLATGGFGSVRPDCACLADVYFYATDCRGGQHTFGQLLAGDVVEFDVVDGPRGRRQAVRVRAFHPGENIMKALHATDPANRLYNGHYRTGHSLNSTTPSIDDLARTAMTFGAAKVPNPGTGATSDLPQSGSMMPPFVEQDTQSKRPVPVTADAPGEDAARESRRGR